MGEDEADSEREAKDATVTYGCNAPGDERSEEDLLDSLGDTLWKQFRCLNLPRLGRRDLYLLDKAIFLLHPQIVRVRVVEVDTFTESERTIAIGGVPLHLDQGTYSLKQKTVILKRASPDIPPRDTTPAGEGAAEAAAPNEAEPPEIVFFWGRNMRQGGNLAVCPDALSIDRLIQAYLVCEVVYDLKRDTWFEEQADLASGVFCDGKTKATLMGVELGEATPAEQRELEKLISDYSFHDASIGVISLVASIYIFGVLGRNDVRVLTLISIGVVAGLHQEATWPWVFKHVLRCSRIADPIVRVTQCRQVHHHQGQLSGKSFLATGLAAFAVYLEVVPAADGETPRLFRVLLCAFQAVMIAVLLVNMVQAVEPMANSEKTPRERLRPWARKYLDHHIFDKTWYLTLSVALVWGGVIAVVATRLPYDADSVGWTVAVILLVVLGLSFSSVHPGMALLGAWGLIWLVPAGLALVLRSLFDAGFLLTNKLSLARRRMTREMGDHVTVSERNGGCSVRNTLILLPQMLPLVPLLLVSLPIRLLYFVVWFVHLLMRVFSKVADLLLCPVSPFRLYPILGDYGSVAWRMGRLGMDLEPRPMTKLLDERVEGMKQATAVLGERVASGSIPSGPYSHLRYPEDTTSQKPVRVPRLGCVAILTRDEDDDEGERTLFIRPGLVYGGMATEGRSGDAVSGNGPPNVPGNGSDGRASIC